MLFAGLKDVLKTFDEHGWKGSFSRGPWKIANGGYDCWFELYYKGLPVARCIAGELESNVSWVNDVEKEKMFNKILEVYDHLKEMNANNVKANFSFGEDLFDYISDYRERLDLGNREIEEIMLRPDLIKKICSSVQEYLEDEELSFNDADFSHYGINTIGEEILNIVDKVISEYKQLNGLYPRPKLQDVIHTCEEMSKNNEAKSQCNEYFKTSDGFFDYYVNRKTGEKKFKLGENDVEVESNLDDFLRDTEAR